MKDEACKWHSISTILTVRITKEKQRIPAKRSKRAGMKKATFVRKLIRDEAIGARKPPASVKKAEFL